MSMSMRIVNVHGHGHTHVPQNFMKYNGVLRGLQSDSAFLKKAMVALCCPESIAEQYAAGSVAFGGGRVTL